MKVMIYFHTCFISFWELLFFHRLSETASAFFLVTLPYSFPVVHLFFFSLPQHLYHYRLEFFFFFFPFQNTYTLTHPYAPLLTPPHNTPNLHHHHHHKTMSGFPMISYDVGGQRYASNYTHLSIASATPSVAKPFSTHCLRVFYSLTWMATL